MDTIALGDVEITRVVEWRGDIAPAQDIVPASTPELWRENASWLDPDFWDGDSGAYRAYMQTWVVRSEGRTILVDTGAGNDKERPYLPVLSRLDTPFLDSLAAAGVRPEDVDLVVNTHVHADHVGWNTVLADRAWVPTFPNATYLINRTDFDFWNPVNGTDRRAVAGGVPAHLGNQNMFEDSVLPVHRAGQALLWEDSHVIDRNLRLDVAAGHTPGSAVLTLRSGGDTAVFVGDVMHSPVQILDPGLHTCFDEDPARASATRRRILDWAADHRALVIPAHFPGHGAAEVDREGSGFAIRQWAPFSAAA
ncbi:MBL fold metallo-hydrolase [Streptomyces capparidis]